MTTPRDPNEERTPNLKNALGDIGLFSILLMGAGGVSSIALLEALLINQNLDFGFFLRGLLTGYNTCLRILSAAIEPALQPTIEWAGSMLGKELSLAPVWRTLFAMSMIFGVSLTRDSWREGYRLSAARGAVWMTTAALLGAVGSGLLPREGSWYESVIGSIQASNGIVLEKNVQANLFAACSGIPIIAGVYIYSLNRGLGNPNVKGNPVLFAVLVIGLFFQTFFLGSAFSLTNHPSLFVSLAGPVTVLASSVLAIQAGTSLGSIAVMRLGLTCLGGFIAAVCLWAADWLSKAVTG